jgi:hypothetical protein
MMVPAGMDGAEAETNTPAEVESCSADVIVREDNNLVRRNACTGERRRRR